jgi:OOP family OmpA-OmpF porin
MAAQSSEQAPSTQRSFHDMASKKLQVLAAALIMGAGIGTAQAGSFFLGGNIGQSTNKNWNDDVSPITQLGVANTEDSDTSFKVYGGFTANDNVDFRLGYADLGEATITGKSVVAGEGSVKSTALFADVIGKLKPASNLALFAKFGVAYAKTDVEFNITAPASVAQAGSESSKEIVFVPGIGISADLTPNFGLVAEYERYFDVGDKNDTQESDIDVISAGFYAHF